MPCLRVDPRMLGSPAAEQVPVPHDILAERRSKVDVFDSLLEAVEEFQTEITESTKRLADAPGNLLKKLEQSCSKGAPRVWSQLMPELEKKLGQASDGFKSGWKNLQAMQYLLEQSKAHSEEVHHVLRQRDAKWQPKVDAENAAEFVCNPANQKAKTAEVQACMRKRHELVNDFKTCTQEAEKLVDDLLDRRWALIGAMVWEVCRLYTAMFQDADKLAFGFSGVANTIVPPTPTESQLVPADSMIALGSTLPEFCEWLEKATKAAYEAHPLPPRRPPARPPLAPSAPRLVSSTPIGSAPAVAVAVAAAPPSSSAVESPPVAPPRIPRIQDRIGAGLGFGAYASPRLAAASPRAATPRRVASASPRAASPRAASPRLAGFFTPPRPRAVPTAAAAAGCGVPTAVAFVAPPTAGPLVAPPLFAAARSSPCLSLPAAPTATTFTEGDAVQVYSSSAGAWVEAHVKRVISKDQVTPEGYWAQAGAVLFAYGNQSKYVMPQDFEKIVRRRPGEMVNATGCVQH